MPALLRRLAFVLVLVSQGAGRAAPAQPAGAPPVGERAAALDSVLAGLHAEGLFEGALAIYDSGGVAYRRGLGTLGGVPLTPRTPLYVASVSKMMTAAAVLSLVAEGRVGPDDPVGEHIAPWPYPDLTVRHLLNQTSGLHFLTALTAHADTTRPVTTAVVLDLVDEHRPGRGHEPGAEFRYDNANFVALAALLEAVTGQPYAEVLRERVFEPAGMDSARVSADGDASWVAWAGGDGLGVAASAEDLLAFDRAFAAGALVPLPLVRLAESPPVLPTGERSRYGFGRFVTDDPRPLVGHFGDGAAAKAGLWRERETGVTYAIVMPGAGVHRTAILTAVMALWNGEPYAVPQPRTLADVPGAVLARHVGVYESEMGRLHVTLEGGQLHLEPEGAGGSEPLLPGSETVFHFGEQDLTWEFVRDGAGATVALQLQGQPATRAARVE